MVRNKSIAPSTADTRGLCGLLPVAASEIACQREHGTETLEQLFEDAEIDPNDLRRPAVA